MLSGYKSINKLSAFNRSKNVYTLPCSIRCENKMDKTSVKRDLQKQRKRGFYSEAALVKKLEKQGYNAVRVPVSNPNRNPLSDIIARCGLHVYAFEVKKAGHCIFF